MARCSTLSAWAWPGSARPPVWRSTAHWQSSLPSTSHSRANSLTSVTSVGSVAERAMKKIRLRILPLIFLIYVVAFLDRANVAYAKLTMSADLGFSEAVYGFGAGIFFIGYLLL